MSDTYTELNPGLAGSKIDETKVVRPDSVEVHRQRIQVSGDGYGENAAVENITPSGAAYGLVTRPIVGSLPLPSGAASEAALNAVKAAVDAATAAIQSAQAVLETIRDTDIGDRAGRLLGHVTVDTSTLPKRSGDGKHPGVR